SKVGQIARRCTVGLKHEIRLTSNRPKRTPCIKEESAVQQAIRSICVKSLAGERRKAILDHHYVGTPRHQRLERWYQHCCAGGTGNKISAELKLSIDCQPTTLAWISRRQAEYPHVILDGAVINI